MSQLHSRSVAHFCEFDLIQESRSHPTFKENTVSTRRYRRYKEAWCLPLQDQAVQK